MKLANRDRQHMCMKLLLIAALALAQETDEKQRKEEAHKKAAEACKKAREALADVAGVRAVSFAGVEDNYRLLISLDEDAQRDEVRKIVGFEYEGLRVNVYTPSTREMIYAKTPSEPVADPPKRETRPKPAPKDPPKGRDVASVDGDAEIRQLEAKEFRAGTETVSMIELLQCDGIRDAFGLPAIKRDRKEGRCTYCTRTTIGGIQKAAVQHITKHRQGCPFLEERLIERLPADAVTSIKKIAELLKKRKK